MSAPSKVRLKAAMARHVNELRREADKDAQKWRCDDPLIASTPSSLEDRQALYTNWHEFAELVCAPIVDSDDVEQIQNAMQLYRQAPPQYLASALFTASQRIRTLEESARVMHLASRCGQA